MAPERTPVLRKRSTASELSRLHPIERSLFRVFEFVASLKFAIFLMVWLIVECAVGTWIESQVNADAAKYFVYSHWRFGILLSLLGLSVLCAALIRFPWKRYQTGFVVIHTGLLTMLVGSFITLRGNLDALMSVEKGETKRTFFDPSQTMLYRGKISSEGGIEKTEQVPLRLGPFTWGHRIFGSIPWRKGHTETYTFANGDRAVIKKFYANCEAERSYRAAENGPPAVQFRIYHPQRADITQWIAADPKTGIANEKVGPGSILLWRINGEEELEHFVNAVPKPDQDAGELGLLGYSHKGKHAVISLDELKKKGSIPVPGQNVTLEFVEYLGNARVQEKKLVDIGGEPSNPVVRVRAKEAGGEARELMAFGAHPELQALFHRGAGSADLLSYFPAAIPSGAQLVILSTGEMGYRAFGSDGLIAAAKAKVGEEYPCWAGLKFAPKTIIAKSLPDTLLIPRPIKAGKTANPGAIVEYIPKKGEPFTSSLVRGRPGIGRVDDKTVLVGLDPYERDLPFDIRLDDFQEPKNPGTRQAAMYTSKVTLTDSKAGVNKQIDITMNEPLRYRGEDGVEYTLYQSGIDWSTGKPISTYTVANDPGLTTKYAGAIILCVGIFLMFYMGGYFNKRSAPSISAREFGKASATPLHPELAGAGQIE